MRVLLTGSSGWLGRFLAPMLRTAGHVVTGLDLVRAPTTDHVGSVVDRPLIDRILADHRIEAIIHTAALHKPDIARYPAQAFVDVNISGTLTLLQAAVAAGHDRFLLTSTTSLMISQAIRDEATDHAVWLDEHTTPLEPRNIYGVTKLAAEGLCRLFGVQHGLACTALRAARFFPEDDDTITSLTGPNLKANEFLNRRLTVEDAARAHIMAMEQAPRSGFEVLVLSAPTPFDRAEAEELKRNAPAVIARHFPGAVALYARQGWTLPASIGRVYDASRARQRLGFVCETDFAAVLSALKSGNKLPFVHDAAYVSPTAVHR